MERASPNVVERCARDLVAAHKAGRARADASKFMSLSRQEALRVQSSVMALLGEEAGASKVAIAADGSGVTAPIFASKCLANGSTVMLPESGFLGIEVEIAVRLSRAITPSLASKGFGVVRDAIEDFFVGIELVGTRFANRAGAGGDAQLADNLSSAGYVLSDESRAARDELSGSVVSIEIDGRTTFTAPGKNLFGGVINPLVASGHLEDREFDGLREGMLVTTGALSGLIPIPAGCSHIRARLSGEAAVEFRLASA